jgi:RND family efflux transporter MFP subunit
VTRLSLAALLLLTLYGCGDQPSGIADSPEAPPVAVETLRVTREEIVEPIVGTGTIAAHKTTDIGPRVDGIIEEIFVRVGDRVAAGEPLFRTRQIDYDIRLREATHALRLARAEAAKAKRDLERIDSLHGSGVVSDERIDAARTGADIASARLGSAETALAKARQDLTDTVVTAPYPGAITRRYVDEGTMMRTMLSSSANVVQIMKTDIVAAIVLIPEVHLKRIRLGTPGRLRIDGLDAEYESEVAIINDRVELASRSIEVRLPIRNSDLSIRPGLFVKAELLPEPRTVTVLKRRGVLGAAGERHVFVAEGGRAVRRPVQVRDLDALRVEVLQGLAPGESVLATPGGQGLAEGVPIEIEVADVDL